MVAPGYVTAICVPYNQVTFAAGHPGGEKFRPGAFRDFIEDTPAYTVRLVDNHQDPRASGGDWRRPFGRAVRFEERDEGLWGEFEFFNTPTGREGAEEVREGTYTGMSVGFYARQEHHDGALRVVTTAELLHVALVDSPAYAGARIIDHRAQHASPHAAPTTRRTPSGLELRRSLSGMLTTT